ncbi:MAG: glycine cleavage T C-terminal barrel domain-containing protein, partial [Lutimonas sp.]
DDRVIGKVTSGTMSPSLKKGIGMGYVKAENAKIGETIFVKIRNNNIPAQIVKLPFYKG